MAADERERVGFFRQRWAQENFQSHQSLGANNRSNSGRNVDLSELSARPPVSGNDQNATARKKSWRDNLRFSPSREAPVGAPTPLSESSSSLRSPVDSQDNTIYSNRQPTDRETASQSSSPAATPQDVGVPKWLNELYTLSWLSFFALMGTLARLGVESITKYPDAPVTSQVLWANVGGSFAMGFFVEDRNLFGLPTHLTPKSKDGVDEVDESAHHSAHLKYKKTIPLYIGLTTGFCGSFTSFSSFIRDAFLALTNDLPSPSPTQPYRTAAGPMHRNAGFSFEALLAIMILHTALSMAALKAGAHFALLTRPILPRQLFPARQTASILNPLFVLIGLGGWIFGGLFLTLFPPSSGPSPINWRARATIPLLFAPPGCILRFYLAKYLNRPSTPNFPLGTFVANIFGTIVLGMAWDLQHARSIGASPGGGNACAVLLGVEEGFCGCLTTVSTWVLEISGLGRKYAWTYAMLSVGIGLAGLIIIMGSMGWTVGFEQPVCG